MLNSKVKNHIWYQCPKLKQCMNKHCWIASKNQFCTQCRQKTKQCECAERMRQLPCDDCKKPNINCECGLKEELTIQEVLNTALEEYENDKELSKIKITSINQLAALMAGSGTDGHCTYDHEKKLWIPGKFIPSPKGTFDWESINGNGKGSTEFILDSGSQLNLIPMRDLRNQGVNIENLPQINLNVTGVG